MAKFTDAPMAIRCRAQIKPLTDGTTAQCGRGIDQAKCKVCKQHRSMFRQGKQLIDFTTGAVMISIIAWKEE